MEKLISFVSNFNYRKNNPSSTVTESGFSRITNIPSGRGKIVTHISDDKTRVIEYNTNKDQHTILPFIDVKKHLLEHLIESPLKNKVTD